MAVTAVNILDPEGTLNPACSDLDWLGVYLEQEVTKHLNILDGAKCRYPHHKPHGVCQVCRTQLICGPFTVTCPNVSCVGYSKYDWEHCPVCFKQNIYCVC